VIKASGLAAGKGVFVCGSTEEAERAIDLMLRDSAFGAAGAEILIEEFMEGEELSLFAITDGTVAIPMLPAQDHKRLLIGDRGPNTGGMGAYAPVSIVTDSFIYTAIRDIFQPVLSALREHGSPFSGLLYAGLMLTGHGPRVVEFNCRFGDPETEAILPILAGRLADYVLPVSAGGDLAGAPAMEWSGRSAVTTVVAASGYPDRPANGATLGLPDVEDDVLLFHAGTARTEDGRLVASGGRVLAITAVADTLEDAQHRSAAAAGAVRLEGKQFRDDIGWRELRRHARAT
jgi:phosphoribosylamine---glycine ligase